MRHSQLVTKVRTILSKRKYTNACYPLESLAQIIEDTERNVSRKIVFYKWTGLILLALIPILSTALSVLVTDTPPTANRLLYGMSYGLTLLTVLNSIFRPSERFKEACRLGVDFGLIKSDFLTELENLHEAEEASLHTLINKFSKLVAPYQKELISMFLPEVAVEKIKNFGIATGRPSYHGAGKGKQGARTRRSA